MTTTNQPTARIRINRTRTSKHGYDATVEVSIPFEISYATENMQELHHMALRESDLLVAELEQRVNGTEAPAADAG